MTRWSHPDTHPRPCPKEVAKAARRTHHDDGAHFRRRAPATIRTKANNRLLRSAQSGHCTCCRAASARLRAVEPQGVGLVYVDDAAASGAGHPQNILRNFGQPQRPDEGLTARAGIGISVPQDSIPVFGGQVVARTESACQRDASRSLRRWLFHLFRAGHSPACWSVAHAGIRT